MDILPVPPGTRARTTMKTMLRATAFAVVWAVSMFSAMPSAHAAVTASLVGSQLQVQLTVPGDLARVTTSGANITVVDDAGPTVVFTIPTTSVQSLRVTGSN